MGAEKPDDGNQDQPGKHAAGNHDSGHARPDNVTNAQVLRRDFTRKRRARIPQRVPLRRGLPEKQAALLAHQEFVDNSDCRAAKNFPGLDTALFARDQNVCAGLALGESQVAMLLHHQRVAKRNHKQNAQQTAGQRQREDPPVVERVAKKNQRRQRKDGPGRNRFARRAHRLDNVVLKDGRFPQPLENRDGDDRNRNGGADRQAGAQCQVNGDRAKDDAQKRAQQDGAHSEFRHNHICRHKRFVGSCGAFLILKFRFRCHELHPHEIRKYPAEAGSWTFRAIRRV